MLENHRLITQRSKELEQIRLRIRLTLRENAILQRSFADLILRRLAGKRFKVYTAFGQQDRSRGHTHRICHYRAWQ